MSDYFKVESSITVGGVSTDTVSEKTANAGVTVDGCLIKDGRVAALATASIYKSVEQTGTGSEQNFAHGFGTVPTLVVVYPTNLTGGAYVVTEGVHTTADIKLTVTTGEKFRVVAFK